jgi:AraC family transcriptional regulator of adaptative response/methylated-DNA-[protein]-cysteine methyltransferase
MGREAALHEFKQKWANANLVEDPARTRTFADQIFNPVKQKQALPLVLKGSNFQLKVWQALLKIPLGAVVSYEDIASHLGQPKAARTVGNAVASNPIGFVIPCHRVIKKMGRVGDYQWGTTRKRAILAWEAAQGDSLKN